MKNAATKIRRLSLPTDVPFAITRATPHDSTRKKNTEELSRKWKDSVDARFTALARKQRFTAPTVHRS
jgi:hypothetical protein